MTSPQPQIGPTPGSQEWQRLIDRAVKAQEDGRDLVRRIHRWAWVGVIPGYGLFDGVRSFIRRVPEKAEEKAKVEAREAKATEAHRQLAQVIGQTPQPEKVGYQNDVSDPARRRAVADAAAIRLLMLADLGGADLADRAESDLDSLKTLKDVISGPEVYGFAIELGTGAALAARYDDLAVDYDLGGVDIARTVKQWIDNVSQSRVDDGISSIDVGTLKVTVEQGVALVQSSVAADFGASPSF